MVAVLCTAVVVRGGKVYHHYENMMFFNTPAHAGQIATLIHPDLSVETHNGTAWVSVVVSRLTKTTLDGIPVPIIEPYEIQVRSYVTGTASDGSKVSGVWLFDLFLSDILTVVGGDLLYFEDCIRVVVGKTKLSREGNKWQASASGLAVTDSQTADFNATADLNLGTATDTDFFVKRTAWFGQRPKAGNLVYFPLDKISIASEARQVKVDQLSTNLLVPLALGPKLDQSMCASSTSACFFVGDVDTTFEAPIDL